MKSRANYFLLCLFALVWVSYAEESSGGGILRVGENLSYERGTAKAKEEVLEFPYFRSDGKKQRYWAYVVHEGKGSRVIFKKAEIEGKKDKTGELINQDFPADHAFLKTLDLIKHDAFLNVYKELKPSEKSDDKTSEWQLLTGGSAVHKKFYKNSKGKWYCIVAVHDPDRKTISRPIMMSYERSREGPLVTLLSPQGTPASQPQLVDPAKNVATNSVFTYLTSRKGF